MKVELDKNGLISLVKGTSPSYAVFDHPLVKRGGSYIGGFHDRWDWSDSALRAMDEQQLLELYEVCKIKLAN